MQTSTEMSPGYLVASPKLDGGPFERAVILLVHHDTRGAMGYIINKPVDVDFGTLISSVNIKIQPKILAERFQKAVYFGGPVRMEQLWVLYKHGRALQEPGEELWVAREAQAQVLPEAFEGAFSGVSTAGAGRADPHELPIGEHWALSASGRVIENFAMHPTEDYFMPVLGYAGWGAGQLEAEIGEGSWLVTDFDDALIFDVAPAGRWQRALERIGVDPMTFLMMGQVGLS